jgi:hypothetical protein
MAQVIFRRLLFPVVLSSIVAICFGYADAPAPTAIGWALVCALWWAQPSLAKALTDAQWIQPRWYKVRLMAVLVSMAASAFVAGDCLAYFLARTVSN